MAASSQIADTGLAADGEARIAWAEGQMPVLGQIRERFAKERPLEGLDVAACLHVTAETASLVRTLRAGGAEAALCSANPLSAQDDVAAALAAEGTSVYAARGEDMDTYAEHVATVVGAGPNITLDDGADLLSFAHAAGSLDGLIGGTEETATGILRLRRLERQGKLRCPVLAVNEALSERTLNDRYGTGQSALDGILRAANLLLAGNTLVLFGYGYAGRGIAQRARGAGAAVVVCEVHPLRALEARMEGYEVMPSLEAAERGDLFVTVTGSRAVLRRRALRAHEGRRRAGQRRPLRRRDRPRGPQGRSPTARRPRCCRWSSGSRSATAACTCWPRAAWSTWPRARATRPRSWTSASPSRPWPPSTWPVTAASSSRACWTCRASWTTRSRA